ncbi:MAG: DUF5700 domain-containing putative Zn-dependent protease [Pseudonocardiaceae bacterium]
MLEIDVELSRAVYDTVRRAASGAAGVPGRLTAALARVVMGRPEFGSQAPHIACDPQAWFAVSRMSDAAFWSGQERLYGYLDEHLAASVDVLAPYLPAVTDMRRVPIAVHPVPGLTTCYGAPHGGQLFGLYDGADPREMLLFLSHTYFHELSSTLNSERSRQAEADPRSADRFRHWLLLLIRNEGIANYAVLGPLRQLRSTGIEFRYFTYAGLVDNRDATAAAMSACRDLLSTLDDATVRHVSRRVSAVLKNTRLPVINLIGIHMAEAIAARDGERALLDVDGLEPEEFFLRYADTGDALCTHLFGPDGAAVPAVIGPAASVRSGS